MWDWFLKYWLESAFVALIALIGSLIAYVRSKFKKQNDIEAGVNALLYDKIYYLHGKFMRQGFIPRHDFENIHNIYEAYHNLGGNGAGTKLYKDLEGLPNDPPGERKVVG